MDEQVKRLMNITPCVWRVIKRTGLSMEELDQLVSLTPCVVLDDDGDEIITFLASIRSNKKPELIGAAYEFGMARLHCELIVHPEKAEKKIRLALESEVRELDYVASGDYLGEEIGNLSIKNKELTSFIEEIAPLALIGEKVKGNQGAKTSTDEAEERRKKILAVLEEFNFPEPWLKNGRAPRGSVKKAAARTGYSESTVKRVIDKELAHH